MTSLHGLKVDAARTVIARGHRITRWRNEGQDKRKSTRASAECVKCHAYVQVNTRPMPNEIDMGGDALALTCHVHTWGPVEYARMTGNPHRKCTGCPMISLDLEDA